MSDSENEDAGFKLEDVDDDVVFVKDQEEPLDALRSRAATNRGKKRSRDVMLEDSEEDEEYDQTTSKRKRNARIPTKKRAIVYVEPQSQKEHSSCASESSERQDLKRRRRRQSTMTQMIDGRRPMPGAEEPKFKPVKRSLRTSRSGKGNKKSNNKNEQQRTLTQMVPGLTAVDIVSDEDAEAELGDSEAHERESQEYNDTIARRLADEGLFRPDEDQSTESMLLPVSLNPKTASSQDDELNNQHEAEQGIRTSEESIASASRANEAHNVGLYDEDRDDDRSNQHVDAPSTKRRVNQQRLHSTVADKEKITSYGTIKTRFRLLSTPEKRRVFEIPSSQSPAESPLSVQTTPQKVDRTPLHQRSDNMSKPEETPSKRKKVTFQASPQEQIPLPASVRKFTSTIQDSEDEDEDLSEDYNGTGTEQNIAMDSRVLLHETVNTSASADLGNQTRGSLTSIDQALVSAEEDVAVSSSRSLEPPQERLLNREGQEPRDIEEQSHLPNQKDGPQLSRMKPPMRGSTHGIVKQEVEISQPPIQSSPPSLQKSQPSQLDNADETFGRAELHTPTSGAVQSTSSGVSIQPHDTLPSTPMILGDDSSDDDNEVESTASHIPTLNSGHQTTMDYPEQHTENLRSPSAPPETQHSYSSRAEQQLQSEYQTYSQYRPHALPPSSMHVAHDTGFSYQATPFAPHAAHPPQPQHSDHISQATTLDLTQPSPRTTPRKAKIQSVRSATTTPHKGIPNLQPFVSPRRPPPLVIPSSFPSPCREVMEGWSSPAEGSRGTQAAKGYSQWGGNASIEGFSIPAPPPDLEDDVEL